LREQEHQEHRQHLHRHERNNAHVHVTGSDLRWGHTAIKNNAQPNGGVRNGVCMVTQISMPSHTRSTFCAAKFGRNSGTTLEELSALGRHANSPVLKN
jgi:hypothetical protein